MEIIGNKIKQILSKNYSCEICDYHTDRKSNITNHFKSKKHIVKNGNKIKQISSNNFTCDICNKLYQTSAGLWKHKKKCGCNFNQYETGSKTEIQELKEFMKYLMKENSDMKNMMLDVIKNGTHNTTNNISHNKSFNLQFFLNETCKDAMNIMDFVDSIKLQLSDLERVGELGYVEGISNIIVKNLNNLDVHKRPVHCTDKKREVLYVKDENKWEKEGEEKMKIHNVIKKVAIKNQRMIHKFKEEHPDCGKSNSIFSDQYNKIIVEAMGGPGDNDKEKEERIIKNITKNVTLDKVFL